MAQDRSSWNSLGEAYVQQWTSTGCWFTMCCDNRCLFFIKVRTGSLICGYIAAVLAAIGVLVSVGLIFGFITNYILYPTNISFIPLNIFEIFFMEFTTGFTCSVLLLYGITENKPVLVKTYVIYGMIHFVLLFIVMIILFCTTPPGFGIVCLLVCIIDVLFIYMVYLTYKIMITGSTEQRSFTNPQNLLIG